MEIDLFEISPKDKIERFVLIEFIARFLNVPSETVLTQNEFWLLPESEREGRFI